MRVLILGGTTEARELKERLGDAAILALKRTTTFNGAEGLQRYVDQHRITHIVDATHPFATQISANAAQTTAQLIRLERPPYAREPHFTYIDSLHDIDLPPSARVFLTTGHHELEALAHHAAFFLIRAINPPPPPLPPHHHLELAQGPFSLQHERDLIRIHRLTHLVSKDSGGPAAKLQAAKQADLPVILIRRPPIEVSARTTTSVEGALVLLSD